MTQIIVTGTDVETTGFDASTGDRITEVAMLVYKLDVTDMSFVPIGRLSTLVNPLRAIPEKVQQITHITPALVRDQPTWDEIGPKVAKILKATDILIAHNAQFDSVFLAEEVWRIKHSLNDNMDVFCTMETGRFATPLGKPPRLTELCWALDVNFDDEAAHRAIYDTERMMEAVFAGLKDGYFHELREMAVKAAEAKTKVREAA